MMKIAVSVGADGKVSPHFGKSKTMNIYAVGDDGITMLETRNAPETLTQHDFGFITDCAAAISGTIGDSMQTQLKAAGIIPVIAVGTDPIEEIKAILTDE